jgi:opacity protein-like surface antigen
MRTRVMSNAWSRIPLQLSKEVIHMRNRILPSICSVGFVLVAGTAFAGAYGEDVDAVETPAAPPAAVEVVEETTDYARTGPYIGLGGTYAIEMFDDNSPTGARTGNSAGLHAKAGWRVSPRFAAELRYDWFHEFDLDPGHIDGYLLSINGKAYVLTGRVQPFALVGLGFIHGEGSAGNFAGAAHPSNGFAMRFGGGLEGYITENLVMGPEFAYVLPTGSANDLDMLTISLGLSWRF